MVKGYTTASAARAYRQDQIIHAEPVQIVIMLYEGAVQRIRQGEEEFGKGNRLAAGIAVYRALSIIAELRRSLDYEAGGELAGNLDRLYLYAHEELVKANLERKAERLAQVRALLSDLRETWVEAAKQAKAQVDPAEAPATVATGSYAAAVETPRVLVKA